MTESVEAIVAEMRAHLESGCACCQSAEFLNRLQSAHDAELGALRKKADKFMGQVLDVCQRAGSDQFRLREAEKDAERLGWLAREFERNGIISFERYSVGVAGCELFTVSTQHVRGYELRGAIDRAMEGEDGNG